MARKSGVPLFFTGGFYQTRSKSLSDQNCVNWYTNIPEGNTPTEENLYATDGISLEDAAPSIPIGTAKEKCRGAKSMSGIPYFVCGQKLYRLNRTVTLGVETLAREDLGAITGFGRVSIATNGTQLCIVVPGVEAYIYSAAGGLTTITDGDFDGPADTVVFINGYFVFNKTGTQKIIHSELLDGSSYRTLDAADAEADPDELVAMHVYKNQLYAFGTETVQPFNDVGNVDFTFDAVPNAALDIGLRAKFAIAEFVESIVFLGEGGGRGLGVYLYSGGAPQKISTEALDDVLEQFTDTELSEAYIITYSKRGADFAALTVNNRTFVFDLAATRMIGWKRKVWHERSSRVDGTDLQWRVSAITRAYNRLFVGDSFDGRIGRIDSQSGNEYGDTVVRICTTQPFENAGTPARVSKLQISADTGEGESIGISYSDNNGQFTNKIFKNLGAIGDYGRLCIFRRLGRFTKSRELRLHYAGDNPVGINKIEVFPK